MRIALSHYTVMSSSPTLRTLHQSICCRIYSFIIILRLFQTINHNVLSL